MLLVAAVPDELVGPSSSRIRQSEGANLGQACGKSNPRLNFLAHAWWAIWHGQLGVWDSNNYHFLLLITLIVRLLAPTLDIDPQLFCTIRLTLV